MGGDLSAAVLDALIDAGAAAAGVCEVDVLTEARRTLRSRYQAGLHGGMAFTFRNPDRSTEPRRALPSAQSAVVVAMSYDTRRSPRPDRAVAEVARYASGDTYGVLRELLDRGAEVLRSRGYRGVVLADDNALVDRSMAVRAGLGWIGKSSNVLIPGVGSWVVLGSILSDADLEATTRWAPVDPEAVTGRDRRTEAHAIAAGCGSCSRCIKQCPTAAIRAPGVLDASRCLSWLLQDTGVFPRAHRVALGSRIYGCDDCQTSCPPGTIGRSAGAVGVDEPTRARAAGAEATAPPGSWVDVLELLSLGDDEIIERFGAWYIPRRDPRYLRRNALVVLGNVAAQRGGLPRSSEATDEGSALRRALRKYLGDEDPLMVQHAAWAARRSGADDLLGEAPWCDHPEVLAELGRPAPRHEDGN